MILRTIGWAIFIYTTMLVAMYLFQRYFVYYPEKGTPVPDKWLVGDMHVITLHTSDGLEINAWYKAPTAEHQTTLIYFHGNAGHIGGRGFVVRPYLDAGYGVLLLSYRGYGGNPGSPSEEGLYKDARSAIDYVRKQGIPNKCIVLYGESLGSGVAVQMAKETRVGALVLQAPYSSLVAAGAKHYPFLPVRYLLKDRFESIDKIKSIHTSLLILHGEADNVIPIEQGKTLFNAALEPKKIKTYPNTNHNDMPNMSAEVMSFLRTQDVCEAAEGK